MNEFKTIDNGIILNNNVNTTLKIKTVCGNNKKNSEHHENLYKRMDNVFQKQSNRY